MNMSTLRKKAQDKLRRKFKYSTNDNYGRGTILIKSDESVRYSQRLDNGQFVDYDECYDLAVVMENRVYSTSSGNPIRFHITKFQDFGENALAENRYKELGEYSVGISLEELDLIHQIAHEMAVENDWEGQIKEHKKRKLS